MGIESVPHWYCTPSRVMQAFLMGTAYPPGYCAYIVRATANIVVSETIGTVIKTDACFQNRDNKMIRYKTCIM